MRYEITGASLPVAICTLEEGDMLCADLGAMGWMTPNIAMEIQSKAKNALKTEELCVFTCERGQGMVVFPADYTGAIMPFHLNAGEAIVVQCGSVLCIQPSVEVTTFFKKRMGGVSDFELQRLTGPGIVLVAISGAAIEYMFSEGEGLRADPAHIVAMDFTVQMALKSVKGLKVSTFGSEGCILGLTGPGRVWMQSMPLPRVAGRMLPLLRR